MANYVIDEKENEIIKRHTQAAYDAWSGGACNMIALANHLNQAVQAMRELRYDSDRINHHPITQLYLGQMAYLAGIGIGEVNDANKEAEKILGL